MMIVYIYFFFENYEFPNEFNQTDQIKKSEKGFPRRASEYR